MLCVTRDAVHLIPRSSSPFSVALVGSFRIQLWCVIQDVSRALAEHHRLMFHDGHPSSKYGLAALLDTVVPPISYDYWDVCVDVHGTMLHWCA